MAVCDWTPEQKLLSVANGVCSPAKLLNFCRRGTLCFQPKENLALDKKATTSSLVSESHFPSVVPARAPVSQTLGGISHSGVDQSVRFLVIG